MSKHTKGKWGFRSTPGGRLVVTVEVSYIAEVLYLAEEGEQKANAHLITAAPELLYSLKECSGYLEASFEEIAASTYEAKKKDTILNALGELMIEVNRTIAKAEGES